MQLQAISATKSLPRWSSDFISAYFFWPDRIRAILERTGQTSLPETSRRSTALDAASGEGRVGRPAIELFLEHAKSCLPRLPHEDVDSVGRTVWREVLEKGPLFALHCMLALHSVTVTFKRREAIVSDAGTKDWIALTSKFDADALIAAAYTYHWRRNDSPLFTYSPQYRSTNPLPDLIGPRSDALVLAGVLPRIGNDDLELVLQEGVADIHAHFNGLRSAHVFWQRVVIGDFPLDSLEPFRQGQYLNHTQRANHELIRWVIQQQHETGDIVKLRRSEIAAGPEHPLLRLNQAMHDGRRQLVDLMRVARTNDDVNNGWEQHRELDLLLTAKSLFIQEFQQAAQSTPGLGGFRRFFSRTRRRAFIESPGQTAVLEYSDAAYFLTQSRSTLRRVELRLQPPNTPQGIMQVFRAWGYVEELFNLKSLKIDVTFAFHLLRSESRQHAALQDGDPPPRVRAHASYDRTSAAIHRFRCEPECASWARRVRRIDLAGQERDATPEVAAFPMRLLRSDRDAIDQLPLADPTAHRAWKWMHANDEAFVEPHLDPLTLCCHAGEDFSHPLEGLFSMAMAMEGLALRPGDTIGHGLAAGWDVDLFNRDNATKRTITAGRLFDTLLWARSSLSKLADADRFVYEVNVIDRQLQSLFSDIYTAVVAVPQMPPLPVLEDLLPLRYVATRPENAARGTAIDHLFHAETWLENVISARNRTLPLDQRIRSLLDLASLTKRLQVHVLEQLDERGIAIEINPSSNFRVSGVDYLKDIPFAPLMQKAADAITATINTDDPGVFGSRIESEYALFLTTLREIGFGRQRAIDVIDRLRKLTLQRANLGDKDNEQDQW